MKYSKVIFVSIINILKEINWPTRIALAVIIVAILATVAIEVTSQPGFCNSCHIMNSYYASWQRSSHSPVSCLDCHLQPGFLGFVKGKINGLAQAVDCMVGRVGTKPSATVKDGSCLRSKCHDTEKFIPKNLEYRGVKFTHMAHVGKVVGGIRISCGTCHSHFAGDEHFSVSSDICFTCHLLRGKAQDEELVQINCRGCHEVPSRVIERGLVTINHAEFISYEASCEDLCHRKLVEKQSDVTSFVCLNCHDFRKQDEVTSAELHATHTSGEKVECYACHGEVTHGPMKGTTLTGMMDCKSCHSDTHNVQLSIYTAEQHAHEKKDDRILSPMFLTHVECTGCHIEQMQVKAGTVVSIGKVAKAVPRACDRCHEKGTGEKYIPFWQGKIKRLYEQVSSRLRRLEGRARAETYGPRVEELQGKIIEARTLVEAVETDGSWGVHNLKYTEAILLRANEIITKAQ